MQLLFSFFLLSYGLCGRILSGDLWVDYANAGSMTELSFSFMLQNPINQMDYIKVALPFPLHSSLVPAYPATEGLSLPSSLTVTYQLVDSSSNIQPTIYTCQALTETIDSSNYYIRLYAADRKTFISIPRNQWYNLKFKIEGTDALQYQKSNSILQVQISTVSSVWANAMVYDDNLAFNFFQLAPTPTKSITLTANPYAFGSAGGYLLTQATYSMYLDVTLNINSYQFNQNLKLQFSISQQSTFTWTGACSSVAKTNVPLISLLDPTLYTCSIDSTKNIMNVILKPAALTLQSSYRFTVNVKNPPLVVTGVNIVVRAIKQVSGVILSYGQATGALNTNQIYITYQQIFVGWGLRPDALLPFDARVFRGNSATPTYKPYNSLSTKFKISQSTSLSTELKIEISIPSESAAYVLANGYTHNLPAYTNKEVKCVVQYSTDTVNRKIACTGVGQLLVNVQYVIGWRMFFPYDNYQSDIDCTKFGLITVYTAQMITSKDNLFILGRGDQFLTFMKSSPDYYVIGRNSSYISYMKTFATLNMMVLSSDFQQFLATPEQVIVTNRPDTYTNKQYNDVYVIGQNLAFMTYLEQFKDLYIAYRLKSDSDITKGYVSTPLIATSMPKNTLAIKTCNSKDWTGYLSQSDTNIVVSSSTTDTRTATEGLRVQASPQSLIFNLKAPYSEVTSVSSSAVSVPNKWGMLIMMSPKIKLSGASVNINQSSAALTASGVTVDSVNAYNQYTLITLKATTPAQIQINFPITATKIGFSLSSFLIQTFSSISADLNNLDIMIATVDGIDGPLNKMTFNGYFLFNGFTLKNTDRIATLNAGFVAYSLNSPMDGSKVPTMLRVKGTLPSVTNFYSLNIFFDQLGPYFSNYYNGDIYCKTTDPISKCKYFKGAQLSMVNNDYISYHTYSRIQIKLATPTSAFDILIPVKTNTGNSSAFIFLGYSTKDPTTNMISIGYMAKTITFPISQTVTHTGDSGSFGPILTGTTLGQTITSLNIKAATATTILLNSNDKVGGAFLYFSQYDYFGSSTVTGWTNGPCYILSYLLYSTNYQLFLAGNAFTYTYKNMKGVVCFTDTTNSVSSAQLTLSSSVIPSKWGLTLPGNGGYSQDLGQLLFVNTNYMPVPSSIDISPTTGIITPTMGPMLTKSVGKWIIPLPVSLTANVQISIVGDSSANLPFTSTTGTCAIYVAGAKKPVGCSYTSVPTNIIYVISINEPDLLPSGTNMEIVHFGLTTNASYNSITFALKCYSLVSTSTPGVNQIIFKADAVSFPYGPADSTYIGASNIVLGSYVQTVNNKAAVTSFSLSFSVISKGLYVTNRVRINLGQYHTDNLASQINPICKIYQYNAAGSTEFSHDWAAVDTSQGLSRLEFWPEIDQVNTNLTYTVKCNNFVATSTSSPTGISARVVNTSADLTGQISTTASIAIANLPSMTSTNQVSATKSYTIPSTYMQISFNVASPGVTTDSIMYIGFPSYYANGLGPDIKCYCTYEIWCKVTDRQLMIRYIGTYASGTTFVITVAGVKQPINYNSGTFYFTIDNDDNPTTVISSGTFVDSVSASVLDTQNFPSFQILSMAQSSNYLREEGVTLTLTFYVDTVLTSVTVGQYLFLVFPPNFFDVLRFTTPTCTLNIRGNTLKNYISSCTVLGMRLKMPFLDDLSLGSVYQLTVNGLINPTNPSSYTYKYGLEITSSSGTSIIARSFSPHANFEMPIFIVNPIRNSLNYYTATDGLITQISTTVNIQSKQTFISQLAAYTTSSYSRNVYLEPLNNLYSFPASLDLLSGQNPFPIRFSALTSGVNYIYFSKTGDGSYYSNLPPLVLSINKNYFTPVSFIQTTFKLPVAPVNTNYTIAVTLPFSLYPMSQVNLTVTLSSSIGLSLRNNPTVIQLYPEKISATILLYINDATLWVLGATTNLVITPSDSNTYAGPATIPIVAVAAVTGTPTATLTQSSTSLKSAIFQVSCTQYGRFVYHISRKFSYNTTACSLTVPLIDQWIQQSSISGLRVSQVYYDCQDVLGMVNIITSGTPQNLQINNLQASTDYTIEGYCTSQIGASSPLIVLPFSTTSNGGYVSKMDFYFTSTLTIAQKIKVVCALALLFEINYYKVSTADGYYCSQLLNSRLLQSQYANYEEMGVRRMLSVPNHRIQIYFGINTQLNSDTSPTTINALSVNQTQISTQLANVVGLPALVSMAPSAASYVGANDVIYSSIYLDVGPNYIYVQGMTMPNNGIIYIIAGQESWPRDPLISQIKQGSGPDGLPPVFYKVLAYRTAEKYSSYAAFTGLGSQNLNLFILGSNDNPFDTTSFGQIRKFSVKAEVPKWESRLGILGVLLLIMMMQF